MKKYHILNGDALLDKFCFTNDEIIIARECLIEGNVAGENLNDFWKNRAKSLNEFYDVSFNDFEQKTKLEFEKIDNIKNTDEVNLWFEFDLFCQCNFWFCCFLLLKNNITENVFFVFPNHESWRGFGILKKEELKNCFEKRIKLTEPDLQNISKMWLAYQKNDSIEMEKIAFVLKQKIFKIENVVKAHTERKIKLNELGRPEKVILNILNQNKDATFPQVFKQFWQTEGIYGFGDIQIKRIYDKIILKM